MRPVNAAMQFSAASTAMRRRVATEALATCGASTTLSNCISSGCTRGSNSNTSRPAAAILPVFKASTSACSSTTGPRAVFTTMAVRFIMASSAAPIRWRVAGNSGTCRLMKSDSPSSVSLETYSRRNSRSTSTGCRVAS